MSASPLLSLPYILQGQAQKHVTYNEAIKKLDSDVSVLPMASTSGAGALILVTHSNASSFVAFSDGTDWRRVENSSLI